MRLNFFSNTTVAKMKITFFPINYSTPTQILVVASLDKMLHEIYLCLVESNKQQIEEVRCKIQAENSETGATPKRIWIRLMHSASVAFS